MANFKLDYTGEEINEKLGQIPTNIESGSLLISNGTTLVGITKEDLIADIIAAIPSAEGGSY